MTILLKEVKRRLLKEDLTRKAYDAMGPEFELVRTLILARERAGLTQSQLARKMKTTQPVIARLESGRQRPSTRTLEKYARATGSRLRIELVREKEE